MPSLLLTITALILTTLLLLPQPTLTTLTPQEVDMGRVPGFTSGTGPTHAGDYLLSTYCFCALDPLPETQVPADKYTEANYLQFEYYNWHRNTTYILHHLCLSDAKSETTCLAPRTGDGVVPNPSEDSSVPHTPYDFEGPLCRSWYNSVGEREKKEGWTYEDRLCYEPDGGYYESRWRLFSLPGRDTIRFNGQKRYLHKDGGQGPKLRTAEEAEEVCGRMCGEHAGMGVYRESERARCHVIGFEDLDDMCPHCK